MSETPDVYRAICQVTKALSHDGIAKSKANQQQGYKFRGIDDVYNALSAVIAGADLCILPRMSERSQEERTTQKGGVLFYVTVRAEFDLVSARDGSRHTVAMYGEAMDSADKATNKAMSAAYKYACLQVFCIPTEGMDDADETTPEPKAKAAQKIREMQGGKSYAEVSMPDPRVETPLETQLKASVEKVREQKPYNKWDMLKAFKVYKAEFQSLGKEQEYRDINKRYGSATGKADGLPSNDGGAAARACGMTMLARLKELRAEAGGPNAAA